MDDIKTDPKCQKASEPHQVDVIDVEAQNTGQALLNQRGNNRHTIPWRELVESGGTHTQLTTRITDAEPLPSSAEPEGYRSVRCLRPFDAPFRQSHTHEAQTMPSL